MNVQVIQKGDPAKTAAAKQAIADCDVHPALSPYEATLSPYLEKRWRDHIAEYGMPMRSGFQHGVLYPKGQPLAARRDAFPPGGGEPGSDLAYMREQHLDPNNVELGVLIVLRGHNLLNPDLAAAVCRATNDWLVDEWTSQEPRLRATVTLPYHDPHAAAAEIERWADDRSFIQANMLSRTPEPLGNRFFWPIFDAAQNADMPLGVHAFGFGGVPITGGGWPSYYMEDMSAHAQTCQAQVASLVLEGVFERFPRLRVVMVEGGLGWLPALKWRLDRLWHKMRDEVPHVKRLPSEYIEEHVWVTSQPIEEPENRAEIVDVLDWIGWDRILYASDYPHWDFDDPAQVLPVQLSKENKQKFFLENAKALYGTRYA